MTRPIQVLIADDERMARQRLKRILSAISQVEVVAICQSGDEVLQSLERFAVDVAVLDIRMPGISGIETAHHMNQLQDPPAVVFTTAYDEYAIDACEARAIGYVLKDISPHAAPYGYTAIIIAWLARRNPWGVLLVSVLMGGLYVGGETVQITMKLPVNIVLIIQALILFFVLGGDILARYRVVFSRPKEALGGG